MRPHLYALVVAVGHHHSAAAGRRDSLKVCELPFFSTSGTSETKATPAGLDLQEFATNLSSHQATFKESAIFILEGVVRFQLSFFFSPVENQSELVPELLLNHLTVT